MYKRSLERRGGGDRNKYAKREKKEGVLRKRCKIKGKWGVEEEGGGGERRKAIADRERNSYCLASPAFPQYTAQVYRMCTPHTTLVHPLSSVRVETAPCTHGQDRILSSETHYSLLLFRFSRP